MPVSHASIHRTAGSYLVFNAHAYNNLVQCMAQSYTIMRIVQANEPEEGTLRDPTAPGILDPVPRHGEVSICV